MKILLFNFFFSFSLLILTALGQVQSQEKVTFRDTYGISRYAPLHFFNFNKSCQIAIKQALASTESQCSDWAYNDEKLVERTSTCAQQGASDQCLVSLCHKRQFLLWEYVDVFIPVVCVK